MNEIYTIPRVYFTTANDWLDTVQTVLPRTMDQKLLSGLAEFGRWGGGGLWGRGMGWLNPVIKENSRRKHFFQIMLNDALKTLSKMISADGKDIDRSKSVKRNKSYLSTILYHNLQISRIFLLCKQPADAGRFKFMPAAIMGLFLTNSEVERR